MTPGLLAAEIVESLETAREQFISIYEGRERNRRTLRQSYLVVWIRAINEHWGDLCLAVGGIKDPRVAEEAKAKSW